MFKNANIWFFSELARNFVQIIFKKTSNIADCAGCLCVCMCICSYTCMHIRTINGKRGEEVERKQTGGYGGFVGREGKERERKKGSEGSGREEREGKIKEEMF